MADSQILREYLVSLGFKTNAVENKKVEKNLEGWDKKARILGKTLLGVAAASQAMVSTFAYQMEKLYYASKRTDSAVGSIQALEYGASRVGVGADRMRGSLESMARNLRSNPGLTGLLNSLGVRVSGRDKSDVLVDLVGQLKKMPFFVAEKYANLFGIDADTLFMLQEGLDELKAAAAARKQMAAETGVDTEKAALAAKEYANQWREIVERAGLLKDALSIQLLPLMSKMADETNRMLISWTKIINMRSSDFWKDLRDGLFVEKTGRVELTDEAKARLQAMDGGEGRDKDQWGGVELSPEAKARLGQAPLSTSQNKGWFRQKYEAGMRALGAKGFQPGAGDEASVDAATADNGKAAPTSYVPKPGGGYVYQPPAGAKPAQQAGTSKEAAELFARLEKQYGLPAGMLDRIWATESARGKNKVGPMTKYGRALGDFQFIESTGKQYGLKSDEDRMDFNKSANASARYMSDLLKQNNGDPRRAAAAYNWGPGNLAQYGLGRAPKETREYIDKVSPGGPSVSIVNDIKVTGSTEPQKTAEAIRDEIKTANSDTIRNLTPRVQ